jgi:hypothetical protein
VAVGLNILCGNSKNYFILVYIFYGPMQKELGKKKIFSLFYLLSKLQKLSKMTKNLLNFFNFGVAVRLKTFFGYFF